LTWIKVAAGNPEWYYDLGGFDMAFTGYRQFKLESTGRPEP
jgi:hypothetical protein